MAEGMLGGILGGEEEKLDDEAPEALAGVEAFAAAVAAGLSSADPEVARKTVEFLGKQSRLLDIQAQHLEDEHGLRLNLLRGQSREGKLRRFGIRVRIGFQLFIVLVATVIGIGGAILIRDAVTSRQVVIEPFHAPVGFPARGVDGTVVASGLLDKLTHLQNTGRVSDERRDLSSAWEHNIKLDIPEMGLSLGEISRLLTRRFGHDVHIDGDLVETPTGGLALTVRGSSVPPKTFSGSVGELDKVTREAAEYVMAKSRPATWVSYLGNIGRHKEAVEFCRANIASVIDPAERADLFDRWATVTANAGGPQTEALVLYQEALKLKPDLWVTRSNVQNTLMVLGKEEDAWRAGEDMRKAAGGRPGRALEYDYSNWDYLTWNLQTWLAATIADAATNHGFGTSAVGTATLVKADIQWRLHELEAAALSLKTVTANPGDPVIGAMAHFIKGRLAAEEGHAEEAAAEMEAFGMAYANPIVFSNFAGYHCWIALAEEAARHPDKADALLNTAGTYVDCYRFHADILDGRGDWLGAQKAYEEAVALAPDLPAAYFAWGLALARHGDISGAVAKLKDANRRGPHWADPLKAWGDVLVKQGKTKEALAKYADALRYAPNWNQLKEAREVLTKQKS